MASPLCRAFLAAASIVLLSQHVLPRLQEVNLLASVGQRMGAMIRERLAFRNPKQICYDEVGCFKRSPPLKKGPQDPKEVDTKFLLYTRSTPFESPLLMRSTLQPVVNTTAYLPERNTRLVIHGFKGSVKDKGSVQLVHHLLLQEDCNVIFLDWEKGAAGPSYSLSAANTQLVGRQLAILLQDLINLGTSSRDIHVIGFSLGAHIAGYAGRELALRGVRLARITGLDPASPLFREQLRTSLSSLNDQDADLVDVIHTDGASIWPAGFGLLKALGDVDFFPNGGQGQPGCAQVRASVIVSHLEGSQNTSVVCNHVRGFQLFLESVSEESCRFLAFPCPSRHHFLSGSCFPSDCFSPEGKCAEMGYRADRTNLTGPLYLVTRDRPPFCGEQLQARVRLSKKTQRSPRGHLQLHLLHGQDTTVFTFFSSDLREGVASGRGVRSLSAARYGSMSNTTRMSAVLMFSPMEPYRPLYLDQIRVADLRANKWSYCGPSVQLIDLDGDGLDTALVPLTLGTC